MTPTLDPLEQMRYQVHTLARLGKHLSASVDLTVWLQHSHLVKSGKNNERNQRQLDACLNRW